MYQVVFTRRSDQVTSLLFFSGRKWMNERSTAQPPPPREVPGQRQTSSPPPSGRSGLSSLHLSSAPILAPSFWGFHCCWFMITTTRTRMPKSLHQDHHLPNKRGVKHGENFKISPGTTGIKSPNFLITTWAHPDLVHH